MSDRRLVDLSHSSRDGMVTYRAYRVTIEDHLFVEHIDRSGQRDAIVEFGSSTQRTNPSSLSMLAHGGRSGLDDL